ncbi:family 20 glycosylhydrolase [Zobellia russellii]|uniref:family 20 glycosylhydrolase n=1 Tax=Zobellia russellii TaxID=248907 RepID=UPI0037DBFD2B
MILKNTFFLSLFFLLFGTLFGEAQTTNSYNGILNLVPSPKEVTKPKGYFKLSGPILVHADQSELKPLAEILVNYVNHISDSDLKLGTGSDNSSKIFLRINKKLNENTHTIRIGRKIEVEGQNYEAVANAIASLVQLIRVSEGGSVIPRVSITDSPNSDFRSVMLDLARFWHPIETIKETIDLLWLYKIKYLSLHLTDNKRFTFPLEKFSKVNKTNSDGSREFYIKEELKDLVEYAKDRGVTVIPEIEVPGHSGILWSTYPEVFGSVDEQTNEAKPLYVVNMAKESTYTAMNEIINEVAEVFYTSPYIHVGGDEVYLENLKKVPEYGEYTLKHNLKEAANGDANELFCHFINRMNHMVKATGKKTIIWEGFHGTGSKHVTVDKDIMIIVWNTTYNHPQNLLDNGYKIVNSTWVPWYMVGAMNFAPTIRKAYDWNLKKWSHWNDSIEDIEVDSDEGIMGGQISFWEQNHFKVIPVLRKRVPVLAAHLWNGHIDTNYNNFLKTLENTDQLYSSLFNPVKIKVSGLANEEDQRFTQKITIKFESKEKVDFKWHYSDSWNLPKMREAKSYKDSIELKESGVLTVQAFTSSGEPLGHPQQEYFQKIEPAYSYEVFSPIPKEGWESVPDFSGLNVVREGVTGFMSSNRLDEINGELFAKVERDGHIDTRFYGLYNPYAVRLKGQIYIPENENYTLRLTTDDGLCNMFIDDNLVAKGSELSKVAEDFQIKLSKGKHTVKIEYYYRKIQNQLNVKYKTDKMKDFLPFEKLVAPLKN